MNVLAAAVIISSGVLMLILIKMNLIKRQRSRKEAVQNPNPCEDDIEWWQNL